MGLIDKIKDMVSGAQKQAPELAKEHGDKVADGVYKATDMVDDKTGGQHSDKLDKVDDMAKDAVDKLDGDAG